MASLKEIYSELRYGAPNKINDLLTKIEPKIEKYLRNERLGKEEEQILIKELENINEIIKENGGSKIIFTDTQNLIKSAEEFEKCVNWFNYIEDKEQERD